MTPEQSKSIVNFWTLVRQIERRILETGYRPCQVDIEENWNCEFEDAYEAIQPILVCVSKPRLFRGVSSLLHMRGPFEADNAHQALMFQLNPEEAMYGEPSLLESAEYQETRKQAEAEVAMLAKMDVTPVAVRVLPRCGADIWDEDYVLQWRIPEPSTTTVNISQQTTLPPDPLGYTLSETKVKLIESTDDTPRLIKDLAMRAGCDPQTAKGYLPELKKMGLVRKVRQGYVRAK